MFRRDVDAIAGVRHSRLRAWGYLLLSLIFAVSAPFALPAHAALTFPPLTGRVVDDAHVLSPQVQADMTAKLAALEQKTGRQLVVATLRSLQGDDIEDYGYQLGRAWGIGQKGKDTGAVFIVAPSEKKVRIEVGYGLEGVLTDALSSVILNTRVLPKFRDGDISGGVVDGTDALVQQLGLDPAAAQASLAQAQTAQSESGLDQTATTSPRHHEVLGTIFSILLVVFVLGSFFRGGRRGGGLGWILPLMFMGGGGFGGRGGDDDFGGGGGGGGGFGGGGGSFGGGGSSGSW